MNRLDAADEITFWSVHGRRDWTCEHDLLASMLLDAISCARLPCLVPKPPRKHCPHCEALNWFNGADAPFTFVAVCELFDLEPALVHRAIEEKLGAGNVRMLGQMLFKMRVVRQYKSRANGKWRNL